jgi:CubicO group peptidase (beta-lactamase class C family)
MERRFLLASGVASLLLRPTAEPPNRPTAAFRAPPEAFLRELPGIMEHAATPGISAAVLSDGRTSWSRGFGRTGGEGSPAVDPETVFEAASLKTRLRLLVMLLVRTGHRS